MNKTLHLLSLAFISGTLLGQPGSLDLSFGTNGKSVTDVTFGNYDGARAILVQDDGKLVVAGSSTNATSDFSCIRLNEDGSLDNTFSGDGKLIVDFFGSNDDLYDAALQPDRKIILGGSTVDASSMNFIFTRLNTDGSTDNSFGTNGHVNLDISGNNEEEFCTAVAVQDDGKILGAGQTGLIGNTNIALVRLNPDGSLDSGFGTGGIVLTQPGPSPDGATSILIQDDGKILVGGMVGTSTGAEMFIYRYNPDGSLDNSFSDDGRLSVDFSGYISVCYDLVQQPNGQIVAGGYTKDGPGSDEDLALVRINPDGSLDNNYGINGKITTDILGDERVEALEVQADGRILIAGYSEGSNGADFLSARYTTNGFLHISYAVNGLQLTDFFNGDDKAYAIAIDNDLRILVAGEADNQISSDYAVIRNISGLNLGSNDLSDRIRNVHVYPNPAGSAGTKLEFNMESASTVNIFLLDNRGRMVKEIMRRQILPSGAHNISLPLQGITAGSFFLRIETDDGLGIIPILKK